MNKQQARDLVRQTFTQAFDKGRFLTFSRNLVNHLDDSKATAWNSQYVKDAFKAHVHRYERLGTYTSPAKETVAVLIVHLTKEAKLERARTAIRNFVADHLKQRDEKDAALVAFVSPTEATWRFSYVKMEYGTVQKDGGNVGVEEHLTPARRFSYLVGEGESCHTAQARFLDLLQNTESDPTLADIQEAFSVEAVTKEFYTQYRELFERIHKALERLAANESAVRREFESKGVSAKDFAKKLMGQIVFLYFLQKKGWLGVAKGADWGSGPHDFLRRLGNGEYASYDNFFNDILEPLFYDTLATDRGHEAWCSHFKCRIPFLNGGLFEPLGDYNWRKVDINLPNKLFTNSDYADEGVSGTGVLDVFDRYNFTVNEAEPLEKEVAIDPEMLGKVFENLIEENLRKGLGSYYTPREIVHYMCQESLINYLDAAMNAEKKLVPRADIETFVHLGEQISHYESVDTKYSVKMPESIQKHARQLDEKLSGIAVCDPAVGSGAFPVGMMTEIVRARCALTPYFNDVHERAPYFFKRHAIQSCLYGVDIDPGAVEIAKLRLWLSLVVDEEDVKQIRPLPNLDYKIVWGNSLYSFPFRPRGLAEIEDLKTEFFNETDHNRKASLKEKIDERIGRLLDDSEKTLGHRLQFDFNLYFSEVFHRKDGFDVALGNPPYLNVELVSKADKDYFARAYTTFYKRFDVFGLFFELALKRLVHQGTVTFIVPQQIFNNLSYKKLRGLMLSNRWLDEVLYLGDGIFEAANNDVCVLFLKKPKVDRIRLVNALDFDRRKVSEVSPNYFDKFSGLISFSDDSSSPGLFDKLLDPKLERVKDRFHVFQGIVTGNNEAYILSEDQIKAARIEDELLHPVLLGRDFEKWFIRNTDRRILYIDGDTDLKAFPHAEIWLLPFRGELKQRRECERGIIPWYSLQWPRDRVQLDATPRIIVQGTRNPRLRERIVATLDDEALYGTQGLNFIVPKMASSPTYLLLAILNSSAINHLFATKFLNVAIKAEYLKDIAVPKASADQERELESLVKKILATKKRDPEADISAQVAEIDRQVYALYGLTKEEIARVEGSTTSREPFAQAMVRADSQ
jgi:type I restriction-modification system DNA methylase subunit